jgi:DMSO/TMAO reductase YedYZ molybdopterin-dependent catalytic subunit
VDAQRIPPGQTVTRLFPVLHVGPVPRVNPDTWRFRIFGRVKTPRELDWAMLTALPHRTLTTDIHCVTGWSKLDTVWEGIPTRAVWDLIEPDDGVTHVMVHGLNDFTTNLALEDFLRETSLFAVRFAGAPLDPEHGGPLRLVVPHLYFWKSAKWVTGLELMTGDQPGFWEDRGYHMHGDPWREERYW